MEELKLSSAIGNAIGTGAATGVLLLILWKVISKVAERWIASLDGIAKAVNDHTRVDLEHHASVRETVVRLEAKVDSALDHRDRTPTSERYRRIDPVELDIEPEHHRATTASERRGRRIRTHHQGHDDDR